MEDLLPVRDPSGELAVAGRPGHTLADHGATHLQIELRRTLVVVGSHTFE